MAMRDGDAAASRANQKPSLNELLTPDLTEGETTADGCITDDELEQTNVFKANMLLLHAQGQITTLENKVKEYHNRAIRAEKCAKAIANDQESSDHNELRELRIQLTQMMEERDAAMLSRDNARQETKAAQEEALCLEAELNKAEAAHLDLASKLEHGQIIGGHVDQDTVKTLHDTIAARDNRIDQLNDKFGKLTDDHLKTLKEINVKENNASQYFQTQIQRQKVKIDELKDKLAHAESDRDR